MHVYVCALYIQQSESVAVITPSGIGWIYDTFWIASRRVARAAMVGFAQVRNKKKCQYVVGSNGRVHADQCLCNCLCVRERECVCVCTYVHTHTHTHTNVGFTLVSVYVIVCVRERVCVCVFIHTYSHTHTHTHMFM